MPEHSKYHPRRGGESPGLEELLSRGFESPPVAYSGRARRLAAATAEAGIEVLEQSSVSGVYLSTLERAHQNDAASRTMTFVSGR